MPEEPLTPAELFELALHFQHLVDDMELRGESDIAGVVRAVAVWLLDRYFDGEGNE
jgi:hypothetical protein